MNTFFCFAVLFAVASANHQIHKISPVQSSWGLASSDKVKEWDGSLSYVSPVPSSGYWPSSYYYPSAHYGQAIHHGQAVHHSPAVYHSQPIHYSAEVAPKVYSGAVNYKVVPSTWSDESYVPSTWSGYYSAGLPVAKVEKQVAPKAIAAPAVKVEEVAADVAPKPFQYSTEIVHDVPAKKEEVSYNVASPAVSGARSVSVVPQVAPQVAPVNKVVSAPAQYSAWSGEVAAPASGSWASDVKPATWTSDVKPAVWASDVKPSSWASEVKPVGWTSEVKPASWAWAQPKPSWRQGAWADVKPASWSSWSEPKPLNAYVSQPAFYGAEYPQTIYTNAHHAAPWSSAWSSAHPVEWNHEQIQKRSERKQF